MTAAFNFTRKTLPQKEGLGEKLTKRRVALGYDLKEVEKNIRIRAKYIEYIENGKYDKLPPDVYVRGFIKTYASFLKLDENKVLKAYIRERGIIENTKKAAASSPVMKPLDAPKVVITPRTLMIFGASLVALTIIVYISWQVRILTAPPKLQITNPGDNVNIEADSTYIEGKTDAGASLFINEVPVGIDQSGTFKEKISLQNGVNIIKVRSQNKLGKKTEETRTVVAKTGGIQTVANSGQIELKLTIGPKSSSILVEVDGKRVTEKAVVMLAGVSQIYQANDKISITANNGGSVSASFNGKEIGPLGKENEEIKRDFIKGMEIK